jgi:tetratricopeptide (TPR) repeat protein
MDPTQQPLTTASTVPKFVDRRGRAYVPAVGPRLKILLNVIFAAVALLGATGIYLLVIRLMDMTGGDKIYTNWFTIVVFMVHVLLGVFLCLPFLFFGFAHLASARHRKNRLAVRLGIILFVVSIAVGLSGLALIQLSGMPQLPTGTSSRTLVYFLHILTPLAAVCLYTWHRWAGPDIKWRWGMSWGAGVAATVAAMAGLHYVEPKQFGRQGPKEGELYFLPSSAHTEGGGFIPADTLMMDDYCLRCHQDIYKGWFHSAHHMSSFNNPPYLSSVRETREMSMKRDGNTRPSRWCAGCHDPVPFFSGAFDDPKFDDVNHPTSQAGITCTVCHAITNIDSTIGNASYTIAEPQHYPFAKSKNPLLQWLNNQVVKAKPDFHKKTFLKPFHRTAEFCATCHKVSLPNALNHYKEFLRGQDHYTPFLLSGVKHGARSFYYPEMAKTRCAECHMPLKESNDFGRGYFDDSGKLKIHDHLFPGGNTGLPWLLQLDPKHADHAEGFRQAAQTQADFLRDKKVRIDLFALREGGDDITGRFIGPLRPQLPALRPGSTYLVEVVIRTLNIGHPFTQGTADSNEVWVDLVARSGDRVIGRSGQLDGPDDTGRVNEWSHFVNILMLDRHGQRINRRNPQDIFTPLYDHQIPPGSGQVVHYKLDVPSDVKEPIELKVRLRYRKFDFEYMSIVHKVALDDPEARNKVPKLPITDLCEDRVILPVEGGVTRVPEQRSTIEPEWQRWNDYGIGLLLTATAPEAKSKPGLRQAEAAFRPLTKLDDPKAQANGYLNLARVYFAGTRYAEAEKALVQARELGANWWTVAWFAGLVNAQNYNFEDAIRDFEEILDPEKQPRERKLDFTRDFVVINELGKTHFDQAKQLANEPEQHVSALRKAVDQFERTLTIDSEDIDAHFFLYQCYTALGREAPDVTPSSVPAGGDRQKLLELATQLADAKATASERLQAAAQLDAGVAALEREPSKPNEPKVPTLFEIRRPCRDVYLRADTPPELRAVAAQVLGQVHRVLHGIYKPDDNAKDRSAAKYRGDHSAAGLASQAVVIYPLDR